MSYEKDSENPDFLARRRAYMKQWRAKNKGKDAERGKKNWRLLRETVVRKYGGRCLCGEQDIVKLTIDHINNDGCQERGSGKKGQAAVGYGPAQYRIWRDEPKRDDLQVLCWNCQIEKFRLATRKPFEELSPAGRSTRRLKEEVIIGYGGMCAICLEENFIFLVLDHVNNDGGKRRRNGEGSTNAYRDARDRNFPDDYQILCANCNATKSTQNTIIDFSFRDLSIQRIDAKAAKSLYIPYHYLDSTNIRSSHNYGAFYEGQLIAALSIGHPVRQNMVANGQEITRLCIHPSYQKKNLGSWFISRVLREYKRPVFAFADTTVGHLGTVYKAANFRFSHSTRPDYFYLDSDGGQVHKKTVWDRSRKAGVSEAEQAEADGLQKQHTKSKLCFIYP